MTTWRLLALLAAMSVLTAWGCKKEEDPGDDDDATGDDDVADDDTGDDDDDTGDDDDDTGDDDTGDDDTEGQARWTFMVFMNGDNDLEAWVPKDLNELEQVGSGDGVHVVVQADRIPGYSDADGDWTDTRRYYITGDADTETVSSTVVEEMGELDMGDPQVLSDFLMWSHANYPADRMALVLWNHGDSWTKEEPPEGPVVLEMISSDETSGTELSIAHGDLHDGLEALVTARGRLDLVAFDACSMASWEVAHSLRDQALVMSGSLSTVGMEGYMYEPALALLRDVNASADGAALGIELARGSVEDGGEWNHSATDLDQLTDLNTALDELAGLVLADPSLEQGLLDARESARGADTGYPKWYLDIRDLGTELAASNNPDLSAAGLAIVDGVDTAVLAVYGNPPYSWVGGLTILFDWDWPGYLNLYITGDGATWSQETRWDDLLDYFAS